MPAKVARQGFAKETRIVARDKQAQYRTNRLETAQTGSKQHKQA